MSVPGNIDMQALSVAVDAGQLRLNGDAADRCAEACARYIDGLDLVKSKGRNLVQKEAFGELESAQQLGSKFFELASGATGSFYSIIQQHIDIAMKMQEVFTKAGAAYRAVEESNTHSIESVGSDL